MSSARRPGLTPPGPAIQMPGLAMGNFRVIHLFGLLMLGSFVSAFVLPSRWTNPARGTLDGFFSPVAWPVRGVALAVLRRTRPQTPVDLISPKVPRSDDSILAQNRELLISLTNLSEKFDRLNALNADRQLVGANLRPLCQPATVIGTDASGLRQALLIGPAFSHFAVPQPVIYPNGIVGRIARTGLTGSTVRLITDEGFTCTGRFVQYTSGPDGKVVPTPVKQLTPLVQGTGENAMAIRSTVTLQQVKEIHLRPGDLVALNDDEWPENLRGYPLGTVKSITPQRNAPLFADIRIEPLQDLLRLRDVMVMIHN